MSLHRAQLRKVLEHLEHGDWQAAHEIVQRDEDSALSCWAHGIVHLMEGDFANARYWYGQAKRAFPRQPSVAEEIGALRGSLAEAR